MSEWKFDPDKIGAAAPFNFNDIDEEKASTILTNRTLFGNTRIENPRPAWWESQVYHFWGDKLPLNFCEEAGELMQAISKMERGIGDAETVLKEMADVYICMGGLAKRYGFAMADVEHWVSQKLLEEKEN